MKVLLSLIIYWTFFSPATSLLCYILHEYKTSRGLRTCHRSALRFCSSGINNSSLDANETETSRFQSCALESDCKSGIFGFTASGGRQYHSIISCCNTNRCNRDYPNIPPREPNGLQCPACFAKNENSCVSMENITCSSDETKCADFTGFLFFAAKKTPNFSFKGCATPSFCDVSAQLLEKRGRGTFLGTRVEATKALCSDAMPASEAGTEE